MVGKLLDLLEDASQGLFHDTPNGKPAVRPQDSGIALDPTALPEAPIYPAPEPDLKEKLASLAGIISKSLSDLPKDPPPPIATPEPTGLLEDVQNLGFKDVDTLLDFLQAGVKGVQDDSDLLLERLVELLAKLPSTSKHGEAIAGSLIHDLWSKLDHPVVSTLDEKYKYREADGSNNCINMPMMGAAGTAYARTTTPARARRPDVPEPEVLFDTLMSREKFEEHPNRISSVLFYLATIITHDIFQSDGKKNGFNLTSSYLDLAPLYGRNATEQKAMRTLTSGLLKPDTFSSKRALGFPPGVGVMLIMFNRFHNYVVTQLASINEGGRFSKEPSPRELASLTTEEEREQARRRALEKYDEDLFQTGRLVTCGLYVNIILRDYVRTILNVNRTDSSWALDPRVKPTPGLLGKDTPEATGNQVSVEFNLVYRWHSSISPRDEKWTEDDFRRISGGKDASAVGFQEFLTILHGFEASLPDDPSARQFGSLKRNEDGTLPDEDLVKIFTESVEDVAGSFGANRIPPVLKHVEVLGIIQARRWNVATLNEFRSFFGLTQHKTFEDINPDPEAAARLRSMYDSPDSVELYPGLVVEKAKPPMAPGSGICLNYTISRAILSDAVSLVRGDRFYTVDYTPSNLTNWGYAEANFDKEVDNGHVLHKLILRAFPDFFPRGSVYAHFPLVVPSENLKILSKIEKAHMYSWEKPKRKPRMIMVRSYKAVTNVLSNKVDFKVMTGDAIRFLTFDDGVPYGRDFCLAGDGEANLQNRHHVREALFAPSNWESEVSAFYAATVPALLKRYSHNSFPSAKSGRTKEVDIVRDVINLANTRFCAALFALPLKNEDCPHGILTEHEGYMALTAIFASIFFDADPVKSNRVRHLAKQLADGLEKIVLLNAHAADKTPAFITEALLSLQDMAGGSVGCPFGGEKGKAGLKGYGRALIGRLLEEGKSVEECVWGTVMPLISANVPNQSSILAQCLDFYLEEKNEGYLEELHRLAHEGTAEADETIMRYMLEGSRLRGTVAVHRTVANPTTLPDHSTSAPPTSPSILDPLPLPHPHQATTYTLQKGDHLLINLATASRDPTIFPQPNEVRLDRPLDSYIHFGWGPHRCGGMEMSIQAQAALLKGIVGLKGLRRSMGARGRMKSMPARTWSGQVRGTDKVAEGVWSGLRVYMDAEQGGYFPVPTTMRVLYEE